MRRPHDTELVVPPHLAQWAVRAVATVFGVVGVGMGVGILTGGVNRFSGVSYSVAASLPGAPESWGITILAAGAAALVGILLGRAFVIALGMLVAGLWSLLFASAFLVAFLRYPDAVSTAVWIYSAAAFACFILAGVYFASRTRKAD